MPENNEPIQDRDQVNSPSRTDKSSSEQRQGTSGNSSSTPRQGSQSDKGMDKEENSSKKSSGTKL